MGASDFMNIGWGKSAREVFRELVSDAQYESGHGGYTGTIAEKGSFTLFELPSKRMDPFKTANKVMECYCGEGIKKNFKPEHRQWASRVSETCSDKWGPAACFEVNGKHAQDLRKRYRLQGKRGVKFFVFFGLASS